MRDGYGGCADVTVNHAGDGGGQNRCVTIGDSLIGGCHRHRRLFAEDGVKACAKDAREVGGGFVAVVAKTSRACANKCGEPGTARNAAGEQFCCATRADGDERTAADDDVAAIGCASGSSGPRIEHDGGRGGCRAERCVGRGIRGADVVGNRQVTGRGTDVHLARSGDAGRTDRANRQRVAVHIGQAAHAAGGQRADVVAGVAQGDVAAHQSQFVGHQIAAGPFGDVTAALERDGIGAGRGQRRVHGDIAAVNIDRPGNAGVRRHCHVLGVAVFAQRQAAQGGSKSPARGREVIGETGGRWLDPQGGRATEAAGGFGRCIVLQHQRAVRNGGGTRISLVGGQSQGVAGSFGECAGAADGIGHRNVV